MISLPGVLTLAFWGTIIALLVIAYAIARFYQLTSGQPSHYRWFVLPMALLGVGGLRYALLGDVVGDPLGDGLMLAGGISLIALCARDESGLGA